MLELIVEEPKLLVARASGILTAEDLEGFGAELTRALADVPQAGLVVDLMRMEDAKDGRIFADYRISAELLARAGKLPRIAIIDGSCIVDSLIQFIALYVPMVDVRVFADGDLDAARAFVAALPAGVDGQTSCLRRIETERDDAVAWEVRGTVREAELRPFAEEIARRTQDGEHLRLFLRLRQLQGFEPEIFRQGSPFLRSLPDIARLGRCAIVADRAWVRPVALIAGALTGVSVRVYGTSEAEEAWAWLHED